MLNNQSSILFYHNTLASEDYFDRRSLSLLSKLCEMYECKVVLSSSWRRLLKNDLTPKPSPFVHRSGDAEKEQIQIMLDHFKNYNIELVGKTDTENLSEYTWDRSGQIVRYIEQHLTENDKFVIFDDEDILGEGEPKYLNILKGHLIRTDFYGNGLDYEHILKAMEIFDK